MRSQGLQDIKGFDEFKMLWDAATHHEVRLGLLHYLAKCKRQREVGYIGLNLLQQITFFLGVARDCFAHHCNEHGQVVAYSISNLRLLQFAMLCAVQRVAQAIRHIPLDSHAEQVDADQLKPAIEETLTMLANHWLVNGFSSASDPERRAVSTFLEEYVINCSTEGGRLPDAWYHAVIIAGLFEIFSEHTPLDPKVVGFLCEWLMTMSWFCHEEQSREFVPFSGYFKVEGRRQLVHEREQQAAMVLLMHAARCGTLQSEQVQNLISRQLV